MSFEDDQVVELRALVGDLRSQKVVPYQRLRAVRQTLKTLHTGNQVYRFLASVEADLLGYSRFLESQLLDQVEKICVCSAGVGVEELARRVGADYGFRRANQRLRWARVVFLHEGLPQVYVREHLRDGRRVRETRRLVGFEHLLSMDLTGRSEVVGEVIRRLAASR